MSLDVSQAPPLELAHILFIDIVGYSKSPIDQQRRAIRKLQRVVQASSEFVRSRQNGDLLCIPTGDGMALAFWRNPEAPVQCAMEVSRALRQSGDLPVRMGIHTGPVYRISDINEKENLAGAGMNMAQRVMDCGDAEHILLSNSVAEILREISRWSGLVHYLGEVEVKHRVRIQLFNLYNQEIGNPRKPQKLKDSVGPTDRYRGNVLEGEGTRAEVTNLLAEMAKGNHDAASKLAPILHGEMHRLAAGYTRHKNTDHTFQASALVHEAYVKLVEQRSDWQSRAHFFGVAAQVMRHILIDHARGNVREKPGGTAEATPLDEALVFSEEKSEELLAVDEALERLEMLNPQQSKIVELRFFGGLTVEETAEALGISPITVKRDWSLARAWLYGNLERQRHHSRDMGKS